MLIIALLVGSAYFYFSQPNPRLQKTVTVTRGDLKAVVNANARVRPEKSVRLAFPFSGMIKAVNVQEGQRVEAGAALMEMDGTESERRLKLAQLNLAARKEDLKQAQQPPPAEELEIAQQSLKKAALALALAENRYKQDATDSNRLAQELAQSDYEIARVTFERATRGATSGQLADLERAVESAGIEWQAAQQALNQTKLVAPFAGTITQVNTKPRELFGGFNPAVELADLNALQLVAEIDEIDVAEVEVGQTVSVRFDAFPGELAQGTLARLFPAASNDRGATVYQAIVSIEPTKLALRSGMGATIEIATIEKKNVLRLPARAIRNAGTQKIVVVREGSSSRNVVIETGLTDGTNTEVLDGIVEGTVVVIE